MEDYAEDPCYGDIRWVVKIQTTHLKELCIYADIYGFKLRSEFLKILIPSCWENGHSYKSSHDLETNLIIQIVFFSIIESSYSSNLLKC